MNILERTKQIFNDILKHSPRNHIELYISISNQKKVIVRLSEKCKNHKFYIDSTKQQMETTNTLYKNIKKIVSNKKEFVCSIFNHICERIKSSPDSNYMMGCSILLFPLLARSINEKWKRD